MKQFRVALALTATASLLSACGGGGANSVTPQAKQQTPVASQTTKVRVHHVRFTAAMRARFKPVLNNVREFFYTRDYYKTHQVRHTDAGGLNWNGGPVQPSPQIVTVYWGWQGIPDGTNDPDDVYDYLNGFFNAIGGGGWINIDTQYYGSNGTISNTNPQLTNVLYDSSTPPNPYSDSDIQGEASAAASYLNNYDVSVNYVIVTPTGYSTSGFGTQWCAYHSYNGSVSYTDLPYIPDAGGSCGQGSVNSPGTNDGVSIVGGHEEGETQTDPQPSSGWTDSSGSEIGDLCAWQSLENNPAAGNYPTQPLWDNAIGGCAQSGP
jgi:hypothetical protein